MAPNRRFRRNDPKTFDDNETVGHYAEDLTHRLGNYMQNGLHYTRQFLYENRKGLAITAAVCGAVFLVRAGMQTDIADHFFQPSDDAFNISTYDDRKTQFMEDIGGNYLVGMITEAVDHWKGYLVGVASGPIVQAGLRRVGQIRVRR